MTQIYSGNQSDSSWKCLLLRLWPQASQNSRNSQVLVGANVSIHYLRGFTDFKKLMTSRGITTLNASVFGFAAVAVGNGFLVPTHTTGL